MPPSLENSSRKGSDAAPRPWAALRAHVRTVAWNARASLPRPRLPDPPRWWVALRGRLAARCHEAAWQIALWRDRHVSPRIAWISTYGANTRERLMHRLRPIAMRYAMARGAARARREDRYKRWRVAAEQRAAAPARWVQLRTHRARTDVASTLANWTHAAQTRVHPRVLGVIRVALLAAAGFLILLAAQALTRGMMSENGPSLPTSAEIELIRSFVTK